MMTSSDYVTHAEQALKKAEGDPTPAARKYVAVAQAWIALLEATE